MYYGYERNHPRRGNVSDNVWARDPTSTYDKKIQGSHERRGYTNNLRLGTQNFPTRANTTTFQPQNYNQPSFPASYENFARYPTHRATNYNFRPRRASTYRYRRPTRNNFSTSRVDYTPHVNYLPTLGSYQPIPYLTSDYQPQGRMDNIGPKTGAKKRKHLSESSSGDESHVEIVLRKTKNNLPIMIDRKKRKYIPLPEIKGAFYVTTMGDTLKKQTKSIVKPLPIIIKDIPTNTINQKTFIECILPLRNLWIKLFHLGIDLEKVRNCPNIVNYICRVNPDKFTKVAKRDLQKACNQVAIDDLTKQMQAISQIIKRVKPQFALQTLKMAFTRFLKNNNKGPNQKIWNISGIVQDTIMFFYEINTAESLQPDRENVFDNSIASSTDNHEDVDNNDSVSVDNSDTIFANFNEIMGSTYTDDTMDCDPFPINKTDTDKTNLPSHHQKESSSTIMHFPSELLLEASKTHTDIDKVDSERPSNTGAPSHANCELTRILRHKNKERKKGSGRPLGSKNKSTFEREAQKILKKNEVELVATCCLCGSNYIKATALTTHVEHCLALMNTVDADLKCKICDVQLTNIAEECSKHSLNKHQNFLLIPRVNQMQPKL
ncbi:hypothetical protein RF11_11177 [Thelohanellus kitauei]|uniref:Uncharacterized protein n=1 Tax=Thelohanellus kitauei TaxID=669202 RepID=A0A0C2N1K2_THEKT|nr:hypothetical protein RF11_11174 [Thelohanellus kitauei]KII67777.1 hypothetical protein RF11_11177 [Thelohanellus kitauei]